MWAKMSLRTASRFLARYRLGLAVRVFGSPLAFFVGMWYNPQAGFNNCMPHRSNLLSGSRFRMSQEDDSLVLTDPSNSMPHSTQPGDPRISPSSPPQSAPRLYRGDEYVSLPRQPETWLLEPLLPTGGSLLL